MIKHIFASITSYFEAIKLIKELKLIKFFLIPALIGLVLGILFISTAIGLSDNLGNFIATYWTFDFGKSFVSGLSTWISGFLILLIGIMIYKHLLMALASPFMTPLSEKVEAHITKQEKVHSKLSGSAQLIRSLKLNLGNLIKEVLITLPLMLLSLIPVIGLFFTLLIFYYQSYYAGIGNMDYTVERHLNFKESKLFYKKNKGIAVGNGFIFIVLLFIPFIGIMLSLPIATVAATKNVLEKLNK